MITLRTGRPVSPLRLATLLLCTLLIIAGCSTKGGDGESADKTITMWTLESQTDRVIAMRAIADAYKAKTGVTVEVVGVSQDQLPQLIANSAAANQLPDVVGALTLAGVHDFESKDLLDTDAAAKIVEALGADTISERALRFTQDPDGTQLAVPSDGWGQLILYRKDLFDQAGLAVPDTFEAIEKAARTLNTSERSGINLPTDPAASFTMRAFTMFALANGCQLANDGGDITLDSPNCAEAFQLYGDLAKNYGPAGTQGVNSTRATYFAGKTAMTTWSPFILPQMAGLDNKMLTTCDECKDDKEWLARNTGFVTALKGPNGEEAAAPGDIVSWAILDGASSASSDFVQYMMSDAYVDWLALSPVGKMPVRAGTVDEPTKYSDAWAQLETGVDTKKKLSDIYSSETLEQLTQATSTLQRWGIAQGKGQLEGALETTLPVAKIVQKVSTGELNGQQAAAEAQKAAVELDKDLQ